MIRGASAGDAEAICAIYNHYVHNTIVTFEEDAVTPRDMAQRIEETRPFLPWLAYESENRILGFTYASRWKSRCAYRHSVESTIYLDPGETGRGIGTPLYGEFIRLLANAGYHTIIGGIALPNEPSIRLHEKLGFRKIAQFEEVGYKFQRWIDVGYWQLLVRKEETPE